VAAENRHISLVQDLICDSDLKPVGKHPNNRWSDGQITAQLSLSETDPGGEDVLYVSSNFQRVPISVFKQIPQNSSVLAQSTCR
jgi:hypothetical protein